MVTVLVIALWICGVSLLGCSYMLFRNSRVYRVRTKALLTLPVSTGLELSDALPSYSRMMWMLFTFKYDTFVRKNKSRSSTNEAV